MTKGHYHKKVETDEIYLYLRGEGYMMMKTEAGECRYEFTRRGKWCMCRHTGCIAALIPVTQNR
jgi:oxalate decarboxylase/phosphoglucose isomerase-like protein (cupin superfamily)